MRRGRRAGSSNQNVRVRNVESEDSDEDYVAEVDDVDDQSDELDSLVGDASEEGSCFEAEAEEEEEEEEEDEGGWRRVVKPRTKKGPAARNRKKCIKKSNKRRRIVKSEDEEDSHVIKRSNRRRVVGSDDEEDSHVTKRSNRRRVVKSDDEEDSHVMKRSNRRRVVRSDDEEDSHVMKRSNRRRVGGSDDEEDSHVTKRSKKRKRVVRSDDEEDSDDDDEEFTPEEEYLVEEEEEEDEEEEEEEYLMLKMETRKRGRPTSKTKTKTSRKSRSKRSVKAVRKPRTKKRSNCNSLRRRVKSDGDEDFIGKGPTLRGRSNKKSVCRKKRVATGSDSDFCSDSSDYEFTISEEEREQVREANNFCGSLAPNLRSSRRIQEDETLYEPKKPPARKGKEKAEEIIYDVGKPVCGICLTEEGKNTVRGTLNCCSHYFCFACIFEWSKVETRCPLCKQRFASISKPARCGRGFDLRDTVIPVPERDQVYQPSEEELRDFLNPYENVICTECDQGGDDALMLLCDLCDSPAHTYCVGLGHEVPEGNWYCDGCRPAALGSSHSQTQDLTPDQRTRTGASDGMSTYENMAEIDLNVTIPETPVSQGNGFLSSPRFAGGSIQAPSPVSGMGVSTVSGRRQIHRQIRYILSNRLSQISPGADMSALGNLIGRGVDSTPQQSRTTDVGPSHHSQYVDRLQERPLNSVQNRDSFPGRLGHMVRPIGQPSTSASSAYTQVHWSGRDRLSLGEGQSQISIGEPLRPCTSRSSIGPDVGVSPSNNRYYEEHANFVKQQVHAMVRGQLKSLSREMNLGHNEYVEISRRSAHTIMAACGLEPRMHDTYEAQPPTCLHLESRLAVVETSPVNGCCLACFEGFVKDVVKRITDIVLQAHWFGFRH